MAQPDLLKRQSRTPAIAQPEEEVIEQTPASALA